MLINFLRDNEIENDRIFVLNNNSNLNNLKNKYNTCVNVKTLDFIPFSSTLAFDVIQSEFVSEKKGKLFICHNKSPKPHRYMILALMKSMGVLENTNWSLIPPTKSHFTMGNFYEYFNHSDLVPIENDLMNLVNLDIKVGDFEKNRNWFNEPHREFEMKLPNNVLIPEDRETLENSYFNIVTESEYINLNKNIIHITEKSIRPFYFYQIPLIVATHLNIKNIK
jgi:hypothetical protein